MAGNDRPDWLDPTDGIEMLRTSANHATVSGSFVLPVGTKSVIIETVIQAGDESNFSLTGHTTGFGYYSQALGSGAYEVIGVDQVADQQLDWSGTSTNGPGVSWHVTATPFLPPTFISRNPAPWQAPTLCATLNWSPTAGTTHTWIAGVAGRRIRLFHMFGMWKTSGAGFGRLMGSGVTGVLQQYDQGALNWFQFDYGSKLLDFGESWQITNDDVGNGQNINGAQAYSLD